MRDSIPWKANMISMMMRRISIMNLLMKLIDKKSKMGPAAAQTWTLTVIRREKTKIS